jgi:hypothetical protein
MVLRPELARTNRMMRAAVGERGRQEDVPVVRVEPRAVKSFSREPLYGDL